MFIGAGDRFDQSTVDELKLSEVSQVQASFPNSIFMTIEQDTSDSFGSFTFEFWYKDNKPADSGGSFKGINLV